MSLFRKTTVPVETSQAKARGGYEPMYTQNHPVLALKHTFSAAEPKKQASHKKQDVSSAFDTVITTWRNKMTFLDWKLLSNTSDDDTYVIFLSHKQKDIDPQYKIRMRDLAARMYENLKGRGHLSFLDKNYNGNSWGDLPNIVAHSKTIVVLLSENFVESPWCVLELLSAIMHQRPVAFFRISNTFKLVAFKQQLVDIGFPFVNALDKYSVEIDYSEDYFESAMEKIVERIKLNERDYPLTENVVTREQVAKQVVKQYKLLRDKRHNKFPNKRQWPSWGTDFDSSSKYKGETKI